MLLNVCQQMISHLSRRKSVQVFLVASMISIGAFCALSYQGFLYLQSQNISQLSVYNEIIKPLVGLVFVLQVILMCLVASLMTPYLSSRGQLGIVVHSSLSDCQLLLSLLSSLLFFALLPVIFLLLICCFLASVSQIDLNLITTSTLGLVAGMLFYATAILTISLLVKNNIMALLVSLITVVLMLAIDEILRVTSSLNSFGFYLDLMIQLRAGLLMPTAVSSWLLWSVFVLFCAVAAMGKLRVHSIKKALVLAFTVMLLIVLNGLVAPLTNIKPVDFSKQYLNSLEQNKAELLAQIEQPIKITAVIDDPQKHDEIRQAYNILKQYHHDIQLEFTNRQALGAKSEFVDQFVTVEIGDLQQSLRFPFDRNAKLALSELVIQLSTRADQWILFVEGHGEASPFAQSNRALSSFYQSLKSLGWPVAMQNFSKQPVISENTKVLVIAASQQKWLPSEVKLVEQYLQNGGNLLLLREANDKVPEAITGLIGVDTHKGTLIDWLGYQSGTPHPAILIVNEFNKHPINTGIDSLLAFPWSTGLKLLPTINQTNFEVEPVLTSHQGVWSEFDEQNEQLAFNPEIGELRQAFNLALALKSKTSQQRIVVVGDSSLLS
jgi:hypothetical protein